MIAEVQGAFGELRKPSEEDAAKLSAPTQFFGGQPHPTRDVLANVAKSAFPSTFNFHLLLSSFTLHPHHHPIIASLAPARNRLQALSNSPALLLHRQAGMRRASTRPRFLSFSGACSVTI